MLSFDNIVNKQYCLYHCITGLPVGNITVGEDPSVHAVLERTASLPVHYANSTEFGGVRQFTSQMRLNAYPDTGIESSPFIFKIQRSNKLSPVHI